MDVDPSWFESHVPDDAAIRSTETVPHIIQDVVVQRLDRRHAPCHEMDDRIRIHRSQGIDIRVHPCQGKNGTPHFIVFETRVSDHLEGVMMNP